MVMSVYFLVIYIAEAFIWAKYVSAVFQRKRTKRFCFLTLSFLYLILFLISKFHVIWFNAVFFLLGNFIFVMLAYDAAWHIAFFHAALATATMSLCELSASYFFSPVPDEEPAFFMLILWAVFSKTAYFMVLFFLSHLFKEKQENNKPYDTDLFLLAGIPVISLIISLIFYSASIDCRSDTAHEWLIFAGFILLLVINLLIFYIYGHSQKRNNDFIEMQLLIQKEHNFSSYYQMLLEQSENQSILVHDIKNHLQTIALLNIQQNYEKVDSYIQSLIQSPALQSAVRVCDNELLNMILSQYQKQCSRKGIALHLDIRSSVTDFLEDHDLTSLFCNLLDNAVEAAGKVSGASIELNIGRRPPSPFTVITLTNSCCVSPFSEKGHKLISKKRNPAKHGFGMVSIKKITEKYSGSLETWYDSENATFHTIVALKPPPFTG